MFLAHLTAKYEFKWFYITLHSTEICLARSFFGIQGATVKSLALAQFVAMHCQNDIPPFHCMRSWVFNALRNMCNQDRKL